MKSGLSAGIPVVKSGLSAGIPVVSEALQVFVDVPITARLDKLDLEHGAVYLAAADPARKTIRLCGTPTATLLVTPTAAASQNASTFHLPLLHNEVVAYLYDVAPRSGTKVVGTLISHGPQSEWAAGPGGEQVEVVVRLRSLCVDVRPGHAIALGIDMWVAYHRPFPLK